ncbi:hypothetical protein BDV95DRAFT_504120 [Massariosphaeria phaeospora]|uniref:Uncharacterized protein n=1 Tax=Massariosphaeria phaeospora TaxID=100035 RepID=A0A7C8I372_9PLEO|nr:hypothetical protein BDV95DRAFT_504120 [Massariosphaeria phaeospora]
MPSSKKRIDTWIDDIPDSKLEGGSFGSGTIYTDDDLRIDNQGLTTATADKSHSLQKASPCTMAMVHVPVDEVWSAAQIKEALKKDNDGMPKENTKRKK